MHHRGRLAETSGGAGRYGGHSEGHLRRVLVDGQAGSVQEVCRAAIRETDSISAGEADRVAYAEGHRVYQALYPALKPIYAQIAGL